MEKLTEEQIESAASLMKGFAASFNQGANSVPWSDTQSSVKALWRSHAKHVLEESILQYAPTEPGAPLTDEEWAEICEALRLRSSLWKKDKREVDAVLARRSVRREEPAKLDGDVIERAAKAGNAACGLQTDDVDSVNRLFTAAAARVIVQDRDAKWEKATAAYLLDEHGWNVGDALFAASKIRARIEAKPKTPEERVTIRERVTDFAVDVDGIMDEYFRPITKAKACRLGLIAQRKQEEKERP